MSRKSSVVQVSKTNVDPRELINIDVGVEVLKEPRPSSKKTKHRPSSKERNGGSIDISSDSDMDDEDDEKSLTSEQQRKNAMDYAAEMNKRNADAFEESKRAKADANDAFQAALQDELEKEQRRKARIKLKKYYQKKKLEDEEKEKNGCKRFVTKYSHCAVTVC